MMMKWRRVFFSSRFFTCHLYLSLFSFLFKRRISSKIQVGGGDDFGKRRRKARWVMTYSFLDFFYVVCNKQQWKNYCCNLDYLFFHHSHHHHQQQYHLWRRRSFQFFPILMSARKRVFKSLCQGKTDSLKDLQRVECAVDLTDWQ